ncbi:hypothetical protein HFP89_05990 [Wenzhouxiangella sp. XN79A]|uniref:hypothetical protein n=1 Tax=Wenzhouxiangella sp. XN79A TaxID=2724193 RepID=UPI00144AEB26|nr:hypothetical protein [Wenzhouxiangella sp. XN79A]NKI34712.1 hypothetical protein [Wenzhouxiangella sp. XN79A]
MFRSLIFAAACLISVVSDAGAPSADVALEVRIEPVGAIPPGTEGTITVTISNFGPNAANVFFSWLPSEDGAGFPPLAFPVFAVGPCFVSPVGQPGPGDNFGFWVTYDLLPGEAVDCSFEFVVLQTNLLSQTARWVASVFFTGQPISPDDDPDLSNNQAELNFVYSDLIAPHPVPLLSFPGILLLAFVLTIGSFLSMRWSATRR